MQELVYEGHTYRVQAVSNKPSGQVAVHKVLGCQVDHARCYLLGDVQHLRLCQLHRSGCLALCHQDCIWTVSPVREHVEVIVGHGHVASPAVLINRSVEY